EALVLEHNLIKQLKPRYNVMLKDAKSYPYIWITEERFPKLRLYRGDRNKPGAFFGPFPHVRAVHETIKQLQIAFGLRDCDDTTFQHRTRPCLKHQIGRCAAPCVGLISESAYREQVEAAKRFLRGEDETLLARWEAEMHQAAERLAFERAAILRDRIRALRTILETADDRALPPDADAFAVVRTETGAFVAIGMRRQARDLGSYVVRAQQSADASDAEVLEALFVDRYQREPLPAEIFIDGPDALAARLKRVVRLLGGGKRVRVHNPKRGEPFEWLARIRRSAEAMLAARRGKDLRPAFADLAEMLGLDAPPQTIAALDNAHMGGKWMVAGLAWLAADGPVKDLYRHFRLNKTRFAAGDDYAGMREVCARLAAEIESGRLPSPDLLLIDGGRGQLEAAMEAFARAGVAVRLVAAAKGKTRKAGEETLYLGWRHEALRPGARPGMLVLARVRDEAHRFAGRYLH
ncbi:MAG: excinuclease ABC subunit C, partial [Zetaproteobacteria bacterium]